MNGPRLNSWLDLKYLRGYIGTMLPEGCDCNIWGVHHGLYQRSDAWCLERNNTGNAGVLACDGYTRTTQLTPSGNNKSYNRTSNRRHREASFLSWRRSIGNIWCTSAYRNEATSKELSLPVKLVMSLEKLAKFPAGPSGTSASEFTIENNPYPNDATKVSVWFQVHVPWDFIIKGISDRWQLPAPYWYHHLQGSWGSALYSP